jgi:hypothetical protein
MGTDEGTVILLNRGSGNSGNPMNAELNIMEPPSEVAGATILLAYRDSDHERLGRKYCELVSYEFGWNTHVSVTEWKFEMLTCAGMDRMAAEEARHSRLVVIATTCGEELPPELKRWIKSWCSRKGTVPETLAVILSESPGYSEAQWADFAFLEEQSQRCGMQLKVYASGLAPENGSELCAVQARRVTPGHLHIIEDFAGMLAVA